MLLNIRPNAHGVFCTNYRAVCSLDDLQSYGYTGERKDLTKLFDKLQKKGWLGGVVEATSPTEDMYIFIEPNAWDLEWGEYKAFFDVIAAFTDKLTPAELADEQFVWRCSGRKTENHKAVEAI